MPLTSSRGFAAAATVASALLAAIARRDLLLRRVRFRRGLDQRLLELLVGLQPVGGVGPLLAVPRVDAAFVHAGMVAARRLQRLHDVAEAERLDFRGVEAQVLRAPANLLARHHALAVFRLRGLDRLD